MLIPWSIVAPNLDLTITNFPTYHGEATFNAGLISIQDYVPMWVNFKGRFAIDGAKVRLERAEIVTDGAHTVAAGRVDFDHWPEQTYQVRSRVQFSRMREIFFANETWKLGGEGEDGVIARVHDDVDFRRHVHDMRGRSETAALLRMAHLSHFVGVEQDDAGPLVSG